MEARPGDDWPLVKSFRYTMEADEFASFLESEKSRLIFFAMSERLQAFIDWNCDNVIPKRSKHCLETLMNLRLTIGVPPAGTPARI